MQREGNGGHARRLPSVRPELPWSVFEEISDLTLTPAPAQGTSFATFFVRASKVTGKKRAGEGQSPRLRICYLKVRSSWVDAGLKDC